MKEDTKVNKINRKKPYKRKNPDNITESELGGAARMVDGAWRAGISSDVVMTAVVEK